MTEKFSAVRELAAQLTQSAGSLRDQGRYAYRLRSQKTDTPPTNTLAPGNGSRRYFAWELILRYLEANGDDPARWFTAFELVQFAPAECEDNLGSENVVLRTLSSILSDMCLKKQILERTERRPRQETQVA